MVEYSNNLDFIFASLADPTRRDILQRVAQNDLSISEIAEPYDLTFAAISKHLMVLEKAQLITKQRKGKQQVVKIAPQALAEADQYLERYRKMLEERMESLEDYIKKLKNKKK